MYQLIKPLSRPLKNLTKTYTIGKEKISPAPLSFDIETTNIDEQKSAYMYIWQFGFYDSVYIGRTWEDFRLLLEKIPEVLPDGIKIIFVHNLSFEMTFLLPRLELWGLLKKVTAKDPHNVLKVELNNGIEFRDSYALSGMPLSLLAKNYTKTQKLSGDLDYKKLRNSTTPLTSKELQYCINDVVVLSEYAEYLHGIYTKHRKRIPLTITGIVRQYVKRESHGIKCAELYPPNRDAYNHVMTWLFRGGYTHANTRDCDVILKNVKSYDLTSAYPSVMLQRRFPCTPFKLLEENEISTYMYNPCKCWYGLFELSYITKKTPHAYESKHKIITSEHAVFENGRLTYARKIVVLLTDVDFKIYNRFYNFEITRVCAVWGAKSDYLPWYLRKSVINFYSDKKKLKAELKSYTGDENGYNDLSRKLLTVKGQLNSLYGMCVTRLNFDNYNFVDGEWVVENNAVDYETEIKKQFLSPFWGIWVTAYVRDIITGALVSCNGVYSDTDSIKGQIEDTTELERHNAECIEINERLYPNFPEVHDIGLFDYEGEYPFFKTLGAKRYCYVDEKHAPHITVAGLPKSIVHHFENNVQMFKKFQDDMYFIDVKNAHYYAGENTAIVDGEKMHEFSSCYICETSFRMTITDDFMRQIAEERRLI